MRATLTPRGPCGAFPLWQVPIVYVQGADYVPEFLFPVDALLLAAGEGQARLE